MKAKEGVVDVLTAALSAHLMAINRYFVQARLCQHWGYERLCGKLRERSIQRMRVADTLIGHILYLESVPKVRHTGNVQVGETVGEQLKNDLKAEQDLLALLRDGVRHCANAADFTTRHLLEGMAKDVDAQIAWIETQLETIEQVGVERYLAGQIRDGR